MMDKMDDGHDIQGVPPPSPRTLSWGVVRDLDASVNEQASDHTPLLRNRGDGSAERPTVSLKINFDLLSAFLFHNTNYTVYTWWPKTNAPDLIIVFASPLLVVWIGLRKNHDTS